MNLSKEILEQLKDKYNISLDDLEDMVKSQYKVLKANMKARSVKTVNMIYIGKFRPTLFYLKNYEKLNKLTSEEYELYKQNKRNQRRLDKLNNKEQINEEHSRTENGDMQTVSNI